MPTYYVSIQTGDDANDGLTPETAWATITKAAQTVVAGDTVYVAPGTYYETVQPQNFGEEGAWIAYIADTRATRFPSLYPGEVVISGADPETGLVTRSFGIRFYYAGTGNIGMRGYIHFDGFIIRDINPTVTDTSTSSHSHGADAAGIQIYDGVYGSYTVSERGYHFLRFTDCVVDTPYAQPLLIFQWRRNNSGTCRFDNITFERCRFIGNTGSLVRARSWANNASASSSLRLEMTNIRFLGCLFEEAGLTIDSLFYAVTNAAEEHVWSGILVQGCRFQGDGLSLSYSKGVATQTFTADGVEIVSCDFDRGTLSVDLPSYTVKAHSLSFMNISKPITLSNFQPDSGAFFAYSIVDPATGANNVEVQVVPNPFDLPHFASLHLDRHRPLSGTQSAKLMVPGTAFDSWLIPVIAGVPCTIQLTIKKNFSGGEVALTFWDQRLVVPDLTTVQTIQIQATPMVTGLIPLRITARTDSFDPDAAVWLDNIIIG